MSSAKSPLIADEFASVLDMIVDAVHPERRSAYSQALKQHDWKVLQGTEVQPENFTSAARYHQEAMVASLLKKCVFDDKTSEKVRKDEAYKRWVAAEQQCYRTNVRLDRFIFKLVESPEDERILGFIRDVRKTIGKILGHVPRELAGRISSGSTFYVKGERNTLIDKLGVTPECTENAWRWIPFWGETAWAALRKQQLGESVLEVPLVPGNRYETVPKNATTDRSIGVEPTLNVFFQLGIGRYLKRRLRSWGLLLKPTMKYGPLMPDVKHGPESQEIHRALAKLASKDGSLATIDLSNASDTVAYNLVRLLLPYEWFDLLSSIRSPCTGFRDKKCEGGYKWLKLEKFSSMGNGYTFELETLIFAAIIMTLAKAEGTPLVPGENFSVYGDDIIVPSSLSRTVINTLAFFGFNTNTQKTFTKGPFRESCGGDFFNGEAVRPVFIKKPPSCFGDWMVLHNQLYSHLDRYPKLENVLSEIRTKVPSALRIGVPEQLGDVGFHGIQGYRRVNKKTQWEERKIVIPDLFAWPLERWDALTQCVLALYTGISTKNIATDNVLGYQVKWACTAA